VHVFEWVRIVGDAVFIVFGILPLVYLAWRMIEHRNRPGEVPAGEPSESLTKAS
jgi:hypothetical protein